MADQGRVLLAGELGDVDDVLTVIDLSQQLPIGTECGHASEEGKGTRGSLGFVSPQVPYGKFLVDLAERQITGRA